LRHSVYMKLHFNFMVICRDWTSFLQTEQKFSSECNPPPNSGRPREVNEYVRDRPTRCQSVPVRGFRSHSSASGISSYRPNSSHQYLSPVAVKDSTIHEANVHLGKPTRTSWVLHTIFSIIFLIFFLLSALSINQSVV